MPCTRLLQASATISAPGYGVVIHGGWVDLRGGNPRIKLRQPQAAPTLEKTGTQLSLNLQGEFEPMRKARPECARDRNSLGPELGARLAGNSRWTP